MLLEPSWIRPEAPNLLFFLAVSFFTCLMFVLSGLLVTVPLLLKGKLSAKHFTIASILSAISLGYITYLLYAFNNTAGKIGTFIIYTSIGILLAVIVYGIVVKKISFNLQNSLLHLFIPIILTLLISIGYNSLLFGCVRHGETTPQSQYCLITDSTFDNVLPLNFAQALYNESGDVSVGDWRSVDRPPIQSGLMLLNMPVASRLINETAYYQILATFLQCLWLVAAFEVARMMRFKDKKLLLASILILITNCFIFINTIFVWPKLLAGTVLFLGMLAFFQRKEGKYTTESIILTSSAIGLSFLLHGAIVFTIIPLVLYMIYKRTHFTLKASLIGLTTIVALVGSWTIYVASQDSSSGRLIKWWIAGQVIADDKGTLSTILDAYLKPPLSSIISNKVNNVKMLVAPDSLEDIKPIIVRPDKLLSTDTLLTGYFFPSLGVSIVGIFLVGIRSLVRTRRVTKRQDATEKVMIIIGFGSLLFWALLSYGPPNATTLTFAGSYTTLLLFAVAGSLVLRHNRRLLYTCTVLSILIFIFTISHIFIKNGEEISGEYLTIGLISMVTFSTYFIHNSRPWLANDERGTKRTV